MRAQCARCLTLHPLPSGCCNYCRYLRATVAIHANSCRGRTTVTIRVHIQVSGPEDLPWVTELLRNVGDAEITVSGPEQHTEPQPSALQEDTLALLQQKTSPTARPLLEQFISGEVTTRQAAQVLGQGKAVNVLLYVPGPREVGAYVVIDPKNSNLAFRLPKNYDLTGCNHAFARNVQDGDPYGVRMRLTSGEAAAEAQRLASEAYERALKR
jgi:hypothetical protein